MHTHVSNGDAIPVGHTRPTAVSRFKDKFVEPLQVFRRRVCETKAVCHLRDAFFSVLIATLPFGWACAAVFDSFFQSLKKSFC